MSRENFSDFEKIAFQYMDFLYGHALEMTSNMESAEMIIQKTFEKAFSKFKSEQVSDYKNWLLDILNTIDDKECLAA
jgi:DNA-directed RNA polymerase specialized sigma24 family protein